MARRHVIREFRPEDASAVAALRPEDQIATPEGLLHTLGAYPQRAHAKAWVAEEDGRVTGFVLARFKWATRAADVGRVRALPPSHELIETAEEHLLSHGARTLSTY